MANYKPGQKLKYLYNHKERNVYVLDEVTVDVDLQETLNQENIPSLKSGNDPTKGHETTVFYAVINLDRPRPYKGKVRIPLLTNIIEEEPCLAEKIRVHILKDMIFKVIKEYKVHVDVKKTNAGTLGQDTKTISGDSDIEIEESQLDSQEELLQQ